MTTYCDPEGIERQRLYEMADPTGLHVLEVGCGDGRMSWLYAADAACVAGIDPEFAKLRAARRRCPDPNCACPLFAQASAEALPFAAQTFDMAIFSWSL